MWESLEHIAKKNSEPWMDEKRCLADTYLSIQDQRRTKTFADRMNRCNLMDMGCSGPRLTWTNNRQGSANTMVKLDRAMCNSEWRTSFPEGLV
ncbi:hypothetical protein ACSBR2_034637 [Camellia fascicularis]